MNNLDWPLFLWPLFFLILIYLSAKDIKNRYIESIDLILLLAYALLNIIWLLLSGSYVIIMYNFIGSGIAWLLFFLIWIVTKKRGIGDGELYFAPMAFYNIGWINTIEALYICFSFASVCCIIGLLTKKMNKKKPLPFIPFLSLGIIISLIFL